MNDKKFILDACCSSRMCWFDKKQPNTIFGDIRSESHILCDGRSLEISPDVIMDYTNMPFDDESFRLVLFDPPHLRKLGKSTWMYKKYGLLALDWEKEIKCGFDECMRVLAPFGVLVFKWNEAQINLNHVLRVIGQQPLFGHTSGKHGKTKWMVFMKIKTESL